MMKILTIPNLVIQSIHDATPQLVAQIPSHAITCVNWKDYPYAPKVEVKIAQTFSHLLLHYDVQEKSIRAKYTQPNQAVWTDSCVEFFISFDKKEYYNIELNCIGTPLLKYNTYLHEGITAGPECLDKILTKSSLGKNAIGLKNGNLSWQLTVALPYSCFFKHHFANLKGQTAYANFYKCGDELDEPHYLSMFPINTPTPNFHCPEFFGEIQF